MRFLFLLYKDLILMSKSRFMIIFLVSIVVFYFFVEYITNVRVKVNLISSESVKQALANYLASYKNEKIIMDSQKPDIIIKIDDQQDYWIVDIKFNSYEYARFIPLLNILVYKIFFLEKGLIDPIKINVHGLALKNYNKIVFSMVFNMVFWGLLSYISSEIMREKLKKTALVFTNVNLSILSKCLVVNLLFFILSFMYYFLVMGQIEIAKILILVLSFLVLCYIYGVLSWVVRNSYLMNIINLMVGFGIILFPLFGKRSAFEVVNFEAFIILFFISLVIGVIVWKKNSYLQKIVWE